MLLAVSLRPIDHDHMAHELVFNRAVTTEEMNAIHRHLNEVLVGEFANETQPAASKTVAEIVRHIDLLLESGDEVASLTPDEWRRIKGAIGANETKGLSSTRHLLERAVSQFPNDDGWLHDAKSFLWGDTPPVETKDRHSAPCTCPACAPALWAAGIKGVRQPEKASDLPIRAPLSDENGVIHSSTCARWFTPAGEVVRLACDCGAVNGKGYQQ